MYWIFVIIILVDCVYASKTQHIDSKRKTDEERGRLNIFSKRGKTCKLGSLPPSETETIRRKGKKLLTIIPGRANIARELLILDGISTLSKDIEGNGDDMM